MLLLACTWFSAFADAERQPHGIKSIVDNAVMEGVGFERIELFTPAKVDKLPFLDDYDAFELKSYVFDYLFNSSHKYIIVPLTINGKQVYLQLVRREIFTDDVKFTVSNDKGKGQYDMSVQVKDLGIHYYGVVVGEEEQSIASLSIFDGQVYGLISSPSIRNAAINKLRKSDEDKVHIIYQDTDIPQDILKLMNKSPCEFKRGSANEMPTPEARSTGIVASKCITYFLEVNYSIYHNMSSNINKARAYSIALFAQSASIYLNEEIFIKLASMNVWTTSSPYDAYTLSIDRLAEFKVVWGGGIPANVGILLDLEGQGGVIESTPNGFLNLWNTSETFCEDHKNRMGFVGFLNLSESLPDDGYNYYLPQYVWSVKVFCHENGHIFGSGHTHDCCWNGTSYTKIDDCGVYSEGPACTGGTNPPPGEGTIMSYCDDIGIGVSFFLGFGPQPGNRIRSVISGADCLDGCSISCPYSYTLFEHAGPLLNTLGTWQANYFITASDLAYNLTNPGHHLEYKAGHYIFLNGEIPSAFEVKVTSEGAYFIAEIDGCDLDEYLAGENATNEEEEKSSLHLVNKLNSDKQIVYPNPTSGAFTVQMTKKGNYSIKIVDMVGAVVYRGDMKNEQKKVIVLSSNLASGNYTIHINGPDITHVEKLTIVR